jgi:hypothetical protein
MSATYRYPSPLPAAWDDIPDLQTLAACNMKGEDIREDYLEAIILKAQPHHTSRSLAHLSRSQLAEHVDALIAWWKQANPRKASLVTSAIDFHENHISSSPGNSCQSSDC